MARPRPNLAPRILLLLMVLLAACSSTPAPRALVMRDVSFPLRDLRFPSGLRVIVEEDHRSPTVGVFTLVGAGSTSDPPGKEGLAHYVEHLVFRSKPDGKSTIWNLIERAGAGAWNASTSFDETVYWEIAPKEALPALVSLHGVRLLAPNANITPEVAAVEREVVRNELRTRNETGIFGSILSYVQHAIFPAGAPYERPVVGTHESLSNVSLEDAQRFTKEQYRADNVTMVVVGDVDMQSVAKVVEESLPAELKAGAARPGPRMDAAAPAPPEPPPAASRAVYQAALPSPELWIGWSLPRALDEEGYLDRFAAGAARWAVSHAWAHDSDIAGVSVHFLGGKQAAMLLCRVRLHAGADVDLSEERVLDQLARIWSFDARHAQRGLAPGRLRNGRMVAPSRANEIAAENAGFVKVQRAAVTGMLLGAQNLVARGYERAELTHFAGDPTAYSRLLKTVMSIDPGRIEGFANKYLTRERARSVLIMPLPGDAAPPDDAEAAMPVPVDEPPAALDADAIRRFVHPPGVSAYRRVTLDNGMEVILGQRAGLPVATVGLSLHGGSATASPPGADQIVRRLARAKVTGHLSPLDFGGHLGDSFDRDDLSYEFQAASGNVGNMLSMLADRAPAMRVDPNAVGLLRREILPSLRRSESRPEALANRAFWQALYGAHPYGRVIVADDLARVDAVQANDWVDAITVPKNAVLAVVGEIEPAEIEQQVRDTFGRWSGTAPPQAPPAPPAIPTARAARPTLMIAHRPGATQGQIRFGCLLPPAGASRARYDVMARLLTDRVTDQVRRSMGGSYGLHASVATLRGGAAHLVLSGDVDNTHLEDALSVLRRALILFEQGHFKNSEVDVARWRVARAFAVRWSTNASVVAAILAARNEDRDLKAIDAYPEELVAVTPEALAADFARCQTAPVVSVVGDEPTVRAAFDKVWPVAVAAPASSP